MNRIVWIVAIALIPALFAVELLLGSVSLTFSEVLSALSNDEQSLHHLIVVKSRLPRSITAMAGGGGLALCGLLMQTYFHNPLAGPSVLGVTSGASLGVAAVLLAGATGAVLPAAALGSLLVLLMIMLVADRLKSQVSLLIFGLMIGYLTSSVVTILQQGASKEALRSFVFWGMGSFADLNNGEATLLLTMTGLAALVAFALHRQLDVWTLGNDVAATMGVSRRRFTWQVLLITGLVAGAITAYCGPVAFLGLAVPHLARGIWQRGNHATLIPAVVLSGMAIGLACDLVSRAPGADSGFPLNAITSLVGAPVVIFVILKGRRVF
ncbi:MAG: iron ABC transporter permease [Flavobacteriales bacterium]|nr:iron ABC transporter permease [Flavobacteriales bacterium]